VTTDGYLLIAARGLRMLAYGALSVVLALYLAGWGVSASEIGLLFTVALAGAAVVTSAVSLRADRWGRRRLLMGAALLMAVAGVALATPVPFPVLLLCAALGAVSPGGQEVGPFQALEQAALAESGTSPASVLPYAWYNLVGYGGVALGALGAGAVPTALEAAGWSPLAAERTLLWGFAGVGALLAGLYAALSPRVEGRRRRATSSGTLHRSRGVVLRLTALFGLDALAGGFVVQGLVALWFHQRFHLGVDRLGPLFFGANLLSALSGFYAARLARRIGLLTTMVLTHLPSNLLLALVPLMPTWPLAAAVLLARHALSQMDVPTRQAYTMALVPPEERAAAAGLTTAVRPAAASLTPLLAGVALQTAGSGIPFFLAGGLKALYDVILWVVFRHVPLADREPSGPAAPRRPRGGSDSRRRAAPLS
jgi:MFS family permease